MTMYAPNQLHAVPLAELQPDPTQPRTYLDPLALEEVTASVGPVGISEPIVCRQDPQTSLVYVVAGERRCAAARKAGLTSVPAVFIASDNYAEIALVKNLLRQDLNAVEEAEALQRLMEEHAYPQEELARIIGKSQATISLSLSLNKLPQAIRDECRKDPVVPKRVLIEIAVKKQERSMLKAYEAYKASVNPEKKEKAGSGVTLVQGALKAVQTAQKKIEALNAGDLNQEEKEALTPALNGIQGVAETLLAAIAETATKKNKTLA